MIRPQCNLCRLAWREADLSKYLVLEHCLHGWTTAPTGC
jgi:hypothetical protein